MKKGITPLPIEDKEIEKAVEKALSPKNDICKNDGCIELRQNGSSRCKKCIINFLKAHKENHERSKKDTSGIHGA